jgi:hypothetical protein
MIPVWCLLALIVGRRAMRRTLILVLAGGCLTACAMPDPIPGLEGGAPVPKDGVRVADQRPQGADGIWPSLHCDGPSPCDDSRDGGPRDGTRDTATDGRREAGEDGTLSDASTLGDAKTGDAKTGDTQRPSDAKKLGDMKKPGDAKKIGDVKSSG